MGDLIRSPETMIATTTTKLQDAAEELKCFAAKLHKLLLDMDAPPKFRQCGQIMCDAAELLAVDLRDQHLQAELSEATRRHDLRNHLHKVHGAIQRISRKDEEDVQDLHTKLQPQLNEVQQSYTRLRQWIESKPVESTADSSRIPSGAVPTPPVLSATDSPVTAVPDEIGHVLIVDDDWEDCNLQEQMLESYGHTATSCRRPERAIAMLRKDAFDICLIDLNMPTMSGWELLKNIKTDAATKHLPVIVVSGMDEDESATRAISLGADDFITKPVNYSLLAARIVNCLSRSRLHQRELMRFLPTPVVDEIRRHPHRLQQGQEATVTVMFCDIRNFSRFSEGMSPSETIRWISDVMEQLSQTILDDGGTLVDFVGDEVMAMWGAPQSRGDHAEAACRCALRIQNCVRKLSLKWQDQLGDQMRVGIGIHSGIVSVGNTGSPQRFKYGPLGNTVNLGSRVQGAGKYLRSDILITKETRRQIPRDMEARRLCSVRVNNINRPVHLFELSTDSSPELRTRDREYEHALNDFETGQFTAAVMKLGKILTQYPEDGPSLLLMNRLIEAKLFAGSDFDPVWHLPGK